MPPRCLHPPSRLAIRVRSVHRAVFVGRAELQDSRFELPEYVNAPLAVPGQVAQVLRQPMKLWTAGCRCKHAGWAWYMASSGREQRSNGDEHNNTIASERTEGGTAAAFSSFPQNDKFGRLLNAGRSIIGSCLNNPCIRQHAMPFIIVSTSPCATCTASKSPREAVSLSRELSQAGRDGCSCALLSAI